MQTPHRRVQTGIRTWNPLPMSSSQPHMKPCPLKKSQHSELKSQELKPHRGQMGRKGNTQVCFEDPVVVTVTPELHTSNTLPQQHIRTQRRSRGRHHAHRQRVEPPAVASTQDPGCLERVDLNTTVALKAELQSLQGAEFNSQKAIQKTLQRSERTKNLVNTRATEVVNVSRSQLLYTSLVSIDVLDDQLISQVLQDRLLLVPATCCHSNKTADGPSPLLFMTPDLLRQKPLPPEKELANKKLCPLTYLAHSTFDLNRRQRCHEATP
uniref:protein phosphatase 1 regulatory subunit 35 n=1 Tax=Scatophagus argus TaxID=75038 RepID=UPI001ED8274F|nr:protein phosphatase 1 regulatory subunit 35 [Scatophagus argus]